MHYFTHAELYFVCVDSKYIHTTYNTKLTAYGITGIILTVYAKSGAFTEQALFECTRSAGRS
jgi:hypothetical protein